MSDEIPPFSAAMSLLYCTFNGLAKLVMCSDTCMPGYLEERHTPGKNTR